MLAMLLLLLQLTTTKMKRMKRSRRRRRRAAGQGSPPRCTVGMGQSFVDDTALGVAWTSAPVNPVGAAVYLNLTTVSALGAANSFLMLFVDTSGRLIFKMQSPVSAQVMVWLEATAPYGNFGTV